MSILERGGGEVIIHEVWVITNILASISRDPLIEALSISRQVRNGIKFWLGKTH